MFVFCISADIIFFLLVICSVADVALSQKLQEELKYEAESTADLEGTPEFLKAFQEQGVWQVRSFSAVLFDRLTTYEWMCCVDRGYTGV